MRKLRSIDVFCDVDIEQTPESFHAHAVPDGIDIRPGDSVFLHDVPAVKFGDRVHCRCAAVVVRGSIAAVLRQRIMEFFALTDLYEVGFLPKCTIRDER